MEITSHRLAKHAERISKALDAEGAIVIVLVDGSLRVGCAADPDEPAAVAVVREILDAMRERIRAITGSDQMPTRTRVVSEDGEESFVEDIGAEPVSISFGPEPEKEGD